MLTRFKNNQEKIAMGLMSFMPKEKDVKVLQETMNNYQTDDAWHLYLWKKNDDIIAIIGIHTITSCDLIIEHISVNPSFRNQGVSCEMINEINKLYSDDYTIYSNEMTKDIVNNCIENIQLYDNDQTSL